MSGQKLKYLLVAIILAVFGLAACSPPARPTPTITPTVIKTITRTPIPATQTPSPTPTETESLNFVYPTIEKICPVKREVPINQLGVKPGNQLFLTDAKQTGIWHLSFEETVPKLLSKISTANWYDYAISPDGRWIAHPIWNKDDSSSIWIESLSTDEKREVWNIQHVDGLAPRVSWLSNNKLLVNNHCHTRLCHFPLKILNIETGVKSENLEIHGAAYDNYLTFFENENQYYALFSSDGTDNAYANFGLYDYAYKQNRPVLQWLDQKVFYYPNYGTNLELEFSNDHTAVVLKQSYGFDFGVFEDSVDGLGKSISYNAAMKRIAAVFDFYELNYYAMGLDSSVHLLFLNMGYEDYSENAQTIDMVTKLTHIEDAFFALDYQNTTHKEHSDYVTFKNYCFTVGDNYFKGTFADGLIAVFESGEGNKLTFLNLKTGLIAHLSGWDLMKQ